MPKFFDPDGLSRSATWSWSPGRSSRASSPAGTAAPTTASPSSTSTTAPYAPGDEIRALDWKILARTDKYHVKLFEDETNLRATILLDCSKSMAFQSTASCQQARSTAATSPPP